MCVFWKGQCSGQRNEIRESGNFVNIKRYLHNSVPKNLFQNRKMLINQANFVRILFFFYIFKINFLIY